MKWNFINPTKYGNYICDLGAYGVSLCWWDGTKWIKLWTSDEVIIYGWIEIPTYNYINLNEK
jgi:hypothetical protein